MVGRGVYVVSCAPVDKGAADHYSLLLRLLPLLRVPANEDAGEAAIGRISGGEEVPGGGCRASRKAGAREERGGRTARRGVQGKHFRKARCKAFPSAAANGVLSDALGVPWFALACGPSRAQYVLSLDPSVSPTLAFRFFVCCSHMGRVFMVVVVGMK